MRNHKLSILLGTGFFLSASMACGQIVYDQPTSGSTGMVYCHWTMEDSDGKSTLNQFFIPLNGFIPLKDNLEARFYLSNVSNALDQSGTDYDVNGLGDVRIQFNRSLINDQWLTSIGLNLPTGKKKLNSSNELLVMEYLAKDYLNLPARRLGEGFGFNLLTGAATQAGGMQLGASVEYRFNGAYEAYKDSGDYNPGDMFSLTAGADRSFEKWKVAARLSYTLFGTDKLNDEKIFKSGEQLGMSLSLSTGNDNVGFVTDFGYIIRGRNTRYDSTETIFDQLKIYGNEFAWHSSLSWVPAPNWRLIPAVELRFIGANEYDIEKSNLFGFGGEIGRKFTDDIDFNIGFKYYTGSANGGDIDLTGYQISAGLMAAFR
jgi:hypothetical protein